MTPHLGTLASLIARALVGLGVAAVLLGRHAHHAPHPRGGRRPEVRSLAPFRYQALQGYWSAKKPLTPRLLDTQTGAVIPFAPAGVDRFVPLGCSPWRDGAGQHHLVFRWDDAAGKRGGHFARPVGLARCTFPEGRVLDRVDFDLPIRRVCWAPDRSDRILFAAADGRLYHYAFPEEGDLWDATAPRPLGWMAETPWGGAAYVQDPCWPGEPGTGGRLLVSLSYRGDASCPGWISRLWWLQLSLDGAVVVAATPVIDPAGDDTVAIRDAERLPAVGMRGGVPWLAYLTRVRGRGDWELWAAPLAPEAAEWPARALPSPGRKLAAGCAAMAPAFSPDGHWVHAAALDGGGGAIRLARFAVDGADAPAP